MKKFLKTLGLIALVVILNPLSVQAKTSYRTSTVCKSNNDGTCNIVYTMQLTENKQTFNSLKYTFTFAPAEGKENGIEKITFNVPADINVDVKELTDGYEVTYTAKEGNITGSTVDLGSYTVTRKTGSEYSSIVKFTFGNETKIINYGNASSSNSSGTQNPNTGAELPIIILGGGLLMATAIVIVSKQKKKLYKI